MTVGDVLGFAMLVANSSSHVISSFRAELI
jgi:hypothetical protein